jgi:hypothetical protein
MLRLRTNILWTATGNNLTFKGDMPSRTLISRIDAKMERPEEREFQIPDLAAHLTANRKKLATAALTILRAYHVAGRPRQNIPLWGGFDQWSHEIREPLVWLKMADPCRTRERVIINDPERDAALGLLTAWSDTFGDRAMLASHVIGEARPELMAPLLLVAFDRNDPAKVDVRRLGAWCRSIEDRIFGELRLTRDGSVRRATVWKVSRVSSVSSKPTDGNDALRTQSTIADVASESASASPYVHQQQNNSPDSPDSHNEKSDEDGVEL